jgi:chemotaxis protein MotB
MALRGRSGGQRFSATIWPGFVDAMTALLLVLMFVLTIFMVVQSVLRQTISTQDDELSALSEQVAGLAQALALEQVSNAELQNSLAGARSEAAAQAELISTLRATVASRPRARRQHRSRARCGTERGRGLERGAGTGARRD